MAAVLLKLSELYTRQLHLIEEVNEIIALHIEAIQNSNIESIADLDQRLLEPQDELETLFGEAESYELEMVNHFKGFVQESGELPPEVEDLLNLRSQRTEAMHHVAERQSEYIELITSYTQNMVLEARNVAMQTLLAFHGYRRAAQIDMGLLDLRK
jgi:methyl-accepting chemotaxis protein